MVGRASVTRELGSPAALPDLASTLSRRSSPRASQRSVPAPELNTSNLAQSSYSLPPTPLTSSFEDFLPSAKRRRTQRAIHSEDQTLPGITETPTHRAFSEPFQIPKSRSSSARPTRNSNLVQCNTQSSQVQGTSLAEADPGTPSSSKSNPQPILAQSLSDQQSITSEKLPRQKTVSVKAESDKDLSTETPSTMGAAASHTRKTRKSMPTRLDGLAGQENGTTPSKASSSRASTPQSSRRDRKSRLAASTGAKITKPPPAANIHSTPTAPTPQAKREENGAANSATPANQPQSATPNTSTRSRRSDRRSTRAANDQTPTSSNQGTANSVSAVTQNNEGTQSQSPSKRSNTVTLNVGRKSLESIVAQHKSQDHEMTNLDTPGHAENGDYHFDYDSEMYRNNYGLDGHMDAPTSPTSLSTTTSTAARTSRRTRKPTIRALESFESEKRHRRPRAASVKAAAAVTETAAGNTRSKAKKAQQSPTSKLQTARKPDLIIIAKHIYELAAAAVAPDFVPAPKVDTWIKELQRKVDEKEKEKEKEAVTSPATEGEADGEGENAPSSNKSFLDNVQASKPWTDGDGWEYTGQVNKHEEEYVIVPSDFEWYRPNNTYEDDELPLPPMRIRSLVQAEKDRALGYPPRIGERNVPVDNQGFFLFENVLEERTMLKAREAARARGIFVTRFMSLEDLETMINLYDNGQPPVLPNPPTLPIPENNLVKAKEPSRKRRRTENTSVSKLTESTNTPKSKRRRQATTTDNQTPPEPAPPEPSADDSPSSEKKSLKITLTFGNKRFLLEQAASSESDDTDQSKQDIEDSASERARSHDMQSHTVQKTSTIENTAQTDPTPSTPAKATDKTENPNTTQATPGSSDHLSPEVTPGGRPRRRAADALMAGFQRHAEDRARRSERARLGHARRKGTPLKTVTGIHGDTVESPIRPAANPMNLD